MSQCVFYGALLLYDLCIFPGCGDDDIVGESGDTVSMVKSEENPDVYSVLPAVKCESGNLAVLLSVPNDFYDFACDNFRLFRSCS